MVYNVEITKKCKAKQGLKSPVLAAKGLPPTAPSDGFEISLRAGIVFDEDQLAEQGWFADTDAVDTALQEVCDHLASATWTKLFDFRPTFELVARWVYRRLQPKVGGLAYIELENITLGVKTRYSGSADN